MSELDKAVQEGGTPATLAGAPVTAEDVYVFDLTPLGATGRSYRLIVFSITDSVYKSYLVQAFVPGCVEVIQLVMRNKVPKVRLYVDSFLFVKSMEVLEEDVLPAIIEKARAYGRVYRVYLSLIHI